MDGNDVGMTSRQVGSWRRSGLIRAEGELAQLRIIAALRRAGISSRRIRAQLQWLRATSAEPPPALRFAVYGREIYVRHSDGTWECDANPGQLVMIFEGDATLRPVDARTVLDSAGRPTPEPGPAPSPRPRRRVAPPATARDAIQHYLAAELRGPR